MTPYATYLPATGGYDLDSGYSHNDALPAPLGYGMAWPEKDIMPSMKGDAETLAKMLTPVYLPADASISDQLFGPQAHQHKCSLEHLANLLSERSKLHKRHADLISHRDMEIQKSLFGARLHGRLDGYRLATRLEQGLAQLDGQRLREETQFWKDTAELRDRLFEAAGEYQALRHRSSLLEGVEAGGETDDRV